MYSSLSEDEREALVRYIADLVENTEKVAALLESRGLPSEAARTAHKSLRVIQRQLRGEEAVRAATGAAGGNAAGMGYNRVS